MEMWVYCDTPGVPLCQFGGGQPSIARCEGGGEPRAGHREEQLETHKAASHHSQLSHLHHSPKHSGEGDTERYSEGDAHGQLQWTTVSHLGQRGDWGGGGTLCGSSSPQRKWKRQEGRHGLSDASNMRASGRQGRPQRGKRGKSSEWQKQKRVSRFHGYST